MSIEIIIDSSRNTITQKFTIKEYGSVFDVLKAAIEWLALGTPFENKTDFGKKVD